MRIQFKDAAGAKVIFNDKCPRNELVIRMQVIFVKFAIAYVSPLPQATIY